MQRFARSSFIEIEVFKEVGERVDGGGLANARFAKEDDIELGQGLGRHLGLTRSIGYGKKEQ